jgi:large subunit ribosomal protein L10
MSAEAESERRTETIPQWKREEVDELADLVGSYESVGVVDVTGIPSRQLQNMRREIHKDARLRMSRNTLVVRALEEVDDGLEDLAEYVDGQVALVVTDSNPFALFRKLEESKTPAPISAGEVAPNDIVIEAGDTGVNPGPFVGDLQGIGAAARIQDGSIHVTEDSLVAEAGDEITRDMASVFGELGLEPKEVGLDLRAVFSDGTLFETDELAIDIEAYEADIRAAAARARNLSINAVYPTTGTAPALLSKALGEAKSLGLQAAIESPDMAEDLLSRADAQVRALAAQIDDEEALPEELRGVEAPAQPSQEAEADDEQPDEEAEDTAETEADDTDDEDDDDEGDGAEGLGEMFG